MPSKLNEALQQQTQGTERLRPAYKGSGFRAPSVGVKQTGRHWLSDLAEWGAKGYALYEEQAKSKAEERSNEIIRKLTPEQIRAARNSGTLLYQDDPYAMEALKFKIGRNSAFMIDSDIQNRLDTFDSREKLDEARYKALQEGAATYAQQYGFDPEDEVFKKGFDNDIVERNIALYGKHDQIISQRNQNAALLNSRTELNGALQDPAFLQSPESAQFLSDYVTNGLLMGTIYNDNQGKQLISQTLTDISQREGGALFLQNLQDKKITLDGAETSFKDLLGDAQWNLLQTQASEAQFNTDAKKNEQFQLSINSALNLPDLKDGWATLQQLKAELNQWQPSEDMTPQRQQIINAEKQLQDAMRKQQDEIVKKMDKQQQTVNKNAVIEDVFNKRIAGEWVSTDVSQMPSNENTGEFKQSDMVNFAQGKLREIDAMSVPDEVKDELKLKYLKADSRDGAFRKAIGTMIEDAAGEWQGAVVNGSMPAETPALDSLRRLRNANPQLIGALYPEQVELFNTMDMMDRMGIDTQVLIDSDRSQRSLTKEQRVEDERAFAAALNDSRVPEIAYMPNELRDSALKIYNSWKYRTGNPNAAMEQVQKYLSESTTTFSNDKAASGTVGVIPKYMLQVTDDPESAEQGQAILEDIIQKRIEMNPWVYNGVLNVSTQGGNIIITDATGDGVARMVLSPEELRSEYEYMIMKQRETAEKEAIEKLTKRADSSGLTAGGIQKAQWSIPTKK
ncbi:internal virion protein [Morganella phage vB_MmoP_MP2]|uniref:Internal virion protein C n=1 Tax=Morganella phage vB_MmoP_MP2 TaxID=1852627 RepID=A0A192Y9X9_9CAUD|nr:internal virion protein [Morganella phage vB_MmoP_MP2]ANM46343.1 internal virion protein C [Morganella phage vB_MmoP_MP2]